MAVELGIVQLQVLNKILQTKDVSIISSNGLSSDFFSDYVNEFNFINTHIAKYGIVPDLETFYSRFPNFEVFTVNESTSFLIDELNRDRDTRLIATQYEKVHELFNQGKIEEAKKFIIDFQSKFSSANSIQAIDILKDTSRFDSYIEKTQDIDKYYFPTGFAELDKIIGGWDRQDELATVVARTNQGKTWILLKFVSVAVSCGLRVGLYSGEMSENKVGYRFDTLTEHISNGCLTHGNIAVENEYKKYIENLKTRFGNASLQVLTPKMIGNYATIDDLKVFIEKYKLDVLFIDQHSLLEDKCKGKSATEKASNISRDLKNLQVLERIPIISASQQNRQKNEDGSQDTTQIAQSDRIGQDSTIVLFLEKKDDIMNLYLAKSRDTEKDITLSYTVDFDKGYFKYIPTEEDGISEESMQEYSHRYDIEPDDKEEIFE